MSEEAVKPVGKAEETAALEAVGAASELLLVEQLYSMGRYLLLGSSRSGTQPTNLQGIWGNALEAQWHGDYHLNINMQVSSTDVSRPMQLLTCVLLFFVPYG